MTVFFPTFAFEWMLPEFEETLLWELDFLQEAAIGTRVGWMFAQDPTSRAHVPAVRWDLTSKRVLTMEFIRGCKATDLEAVQRLGARPRDVAAEACRVFGDMIHVHGLVHCDPHPGNLMVRQHPTTGQWQLVVLDHGMYRRLSSRFRRAYCALWKALLLRDPAAGETAIQDLDLPRDAYDVLSLMLTYRLGRRADEQQLRSTIDRLRTQPREAASEFMQRLPRDMLFVFRTTGLVRSLNLALGGTTRDRITAFGDSAVRGMVLTDDVAQLRDALTVESALLNSTMELDELMEETADAPPGVGWWWRVIYGTSGIPRVKEPEFPFARINEPCDSELAAWARAHAVQVAALPEHSADDPAVRRVLGEDAARRASAGSHMDSVLGNASVREAGAAARQAVTLADNHGDVIRVPGRTPPSRQWQAWFEVLRVRMILRLADAVTWFVWFFSTGGEVPQNWGELRGLRRDPKEEATAADEAAQRRREHEDKMRSRQWG